MQKITRIGCQCKLVDKLLHKIEELREEMVKTSKKYGLNDPKAIKISQKLDKYLNLYEKKINEKK